MCVRERREEERESFKVLQQEMVSPYKFVEFGIVDPSVPTSVDLELNIEKQ